MFKIFKNKKAKGEVRKPIEVKVVQVKSDSPIARHFKNKQHTIILIEKEALSQ